MYSTSYSLTQFIHQENPLSKINLCIETGNYRQLKKLLQSLSPNDIAAVINSQVGNQSLLMRAVLQWTQCQQQQIYYDDFKSEESLDAKLYSHANVIRLLVSYGAEDKTVGEYLFDTYQHQLLQNHTDNTSDYLNEMHHTIGEYLSYKNSQKQTRLRAIYETITTFNNVRDLKSFYQFIMANTKKIFPDKKTLKDFEKNYHVTLVNLQEFNSESFIKTIEKVINNPKKNSTFSKGWDMSRASFGALSECSCAYFSRKTNSRRNNLENKIINDTLALKPLQSCQQLNYLSLGFGEGLEDFILIGRLIQKGYQKIKVVLIEPLVSIASLRQFKELNALAIKYQINLEISQFKSINQFKTENPNETLDVITAIDFENILKGNYFNDVIATHKLLNETGRFYFSMQEYDICFSKTNCLSYVADSQNPSIDAAKNALEKFHHSGSELHYASLELSFNFSEWVEVIPKLANQECKEISFTFIHPKKLNYFDAITKDNLPELNAENLQYLIKLMLPKQAVKVELVNSLEEFKNHTNESPEKNFQIVTMLGNIAKNKSEADEMTDWLHTRFANAKLFYSIFEFTNGPNEKAIVHESYNLENSSNIHRSLP